jgi:taurine dioxygenase
MAMKVTPLSTPLGAEVTGVDLSRPLDAETVSGIQAAWLEHLVLVFRDQDLSEQDQIRFTEHFGPLGGRKRQEARAEGDAVHPSVMLVSNIRKDGKPIGSLPDGDMMFHSDGAFTEQPYKATILHAIEVPRTGGDTLFANLYAAYEALPEDTRRKLEGLAAYHCYYAGATQKTGPAGSLSGEFTRPVVQVHDETGRRALFVSRLMTARIEGLPGAEGEAFLARLLDHTERPEFIYTHRWRPGDLVMWDNRCTNHARTDFSPSERRLLRRTATLTGQAA